MFYDLDIEGVRCNRIQSHGHEVSIRHKGSVESAFKIEEYHLLRTT